MSSCRSIAIVLISVLIVILPGCHGLSDQFAEAGRTLTDRRSWGLGDGDAAAPAPSASAPNDCAVAPSDAASGASTPEQLLACFQYAAAEHDANALLALTCHGKTRVQCKHSAEDRAEAEEWLRERAKLPWTSVLGRWVVRPELELTVAVDTWPSSSRVSAVVLCKIAGAVDAGAPRWAICDIDELAREDAQRHVPR